MSAAVVNSAFTERSASSVMRSNIRDGDGVCRSLSVSGAFWFLVATATPSFPGCQLNRTTGEIGARFLA
jgi:hypothetical protein